MSDPIEEMTAKFLRDSDDAGESEKRVVASLIKRLRVSRDPSRESVASLTVGERWADRITLFGGSWTFILISVFTLIGWVVLNTVILAWLKASFDPFPYIFLNLILSMLAALQAPIIMMSQNRNASKDRVAAVRDYEVNLKAELEILTLHRKIDMLRREQWAELLEVQREQTQMLTRLLESREKSPGS